MKSILISLCMILVLTGSCFASTTRTSSIRTNSPHGIEETLLKVATGMAVELDISKALIANERDLVGDIKNIGQYITVWVNGEKVDAKVLTNWIKLKGSFGEFRDSLSINNGSVVIDDSMALFSSARNLVKIERMLRRFLADKGHVDGTVAYSYAFWHNGTLVKRYTEIKDDHLYLRTDLSGGGMGQLNWATLHINATERPGGTTIVSTLVANTSISSRCCIIQKIINRKMDELMGQSLWRMERRAVEVTKKGEHDLFKVVVSFIITVSKNGFGYRR